MAELSKKLIDLAGLQAFKAKLMESAGNNSKVTLEHTEGSLVYTIKQNGTKVGDINIPKDLVVKSGSVVTNPVGQNPGTYIELVLNDETQTKIYVNVSSLIEYVTSGSQTNDAIQIAVDASTHKVTASVKDKSITAAMLAESYVTTGVFEGYKNGADASLGQLAADVVTAQETANNAVDAASNNTAAINAINNETTGILKRAKDYADGKETAIKNILGSKFMAAAGSTVQFYVEEAKTAADNAAAAASTADGKAVAAKNAADKANNDIAAMDFSSASTGSEYVKVGVTQVNGKVTGVAVTSEIASTDDVNGLFN